MSQNGPSRRSSCGTVGLRWFVPSGRGVIPHRKALGGVHQPVCSVMARRLIVENYAGDLPLSKPLLGIGGMLGMALFQITYRAIDIEPDASIAFERRLVLPSLMGGAITRHDAVLTT